MDVLIAAGLMLLLLALLGGGLWIGLSLLAVALIGMELFTSRPVGDSMMLTIWGSTSSWTLTALPLFLWMGEILFRSKLSDDMFKGLAPWLERLPGRLLHTNIQRDLHGAFVKAEQLCQIDRVVPQRVAHRTFSSLGVIPAPQGRSHAEFNHQTLHLAVLLRRENETPVAPDGQPHHGPRLGQEHVRHGRTQGAAVVVHHKINQAFIAHEPRA